MPGGGNLWDQIGLPAEQLLPIMFGDKVHAKNQGVLYEKSIITLMKGKTHSVLTSHTLPSLTKHWL